MLTSLNENIMSFQCRCNNLTLVWSNILSRRGSVENKRDKYLKLAFPKTLRKVKSGSASDFLPARSDMLNGGNLTIPDTRIRPGNRGFNASNEW